MLNIVSLGFCMWDIPALVVLLLAITVFIVYNRQMKKKEQELSELLAQNMADQAVDESYK
ncbi:hypothetical protein [Anaerolentibacter hominis]|uniref:hypothetical protein n=1 Tax=Anaerolentibacter hominis TaxID=3079009 RepID=UPI0031B83688